MEREKLAAEILGFVSASYPDIRVRVEPWPHDPGREAVYFEDPKFALIYPAQRYHYLSHLIPAEFQERHLANTVWLELAPGERPEDLQYPDDDLVHAIMPDVMKCVVGAKVLDALDDVLSPTVGEAGACWGDYRHSRPILLARGFTEGELFDVFHVLMAQGGYCDCEILFNVAPASRLAAAYWSARAEGRPVPDPHGRAV